MFERECKVYAFLLDYGRRLAADIDDARFIDQPSPGINHPAWLFGHLAISTEFALQLLSEPRTLKLSWFKDFGPGSAPRADRTTYPSKAELLTAWETGHERVDRAARVAPEGSLGDPHSVDIPALKLFLPTKADGVAHLLTSHEASHLGHLSNWRRQSGLPYLF